MLNEEEQKIYSSIYDYEHTDDLPGYLNIAPYHKDIDAVVILFTNTSVGNSWMKLESVFKRIIRIQKQRISNVNNISHQIKVRYFTHIVY